MADTNNTKQLPEAVAAKFIMKPGFAVGTYHFKAEKLQLDKISLEKADEIVGNGFDILMPKKQNGKEEKK